MLDNVYHYYMQFMPEYVSFPFYLLLSSFCSFELIIWRFNKTIANLSEPIIKQLKDQMKLQKWEKTNLIDNYYRLKELTEKSHRTIMKLAKSYEVYK